MSPHISPHVLVGLVRGRLVRRLTATGEGRPWRTRRRARGGSCGEEGHPLFLPGEGEGEGGRQQGAGEEGGVRGEHPLFVPIVGDEQGEEGGGVVPREQGRGQIGRPTWQLRTPKRIRCGRLRCGRGGLGSNPRGREGRGVGCRFPAAGTRPDRGRERCRCRGRGHGNGERRALRRRPVWVRRGRRGGECPWEGLRKGIKGRGSGLGCLRCGCGR